MASLLRNLTPKFIRKAFEADHQKVRQARVNELPQSRLEQKHVENCQLVLDRSTMLEKLGERKTVAELGVNRGEFSHELLGTLKPEKLHLVDVWATDRYHSGLFESIQTEFAESIKTGGVKIHRKLSTDAAHDFEDDYFDLVYIDTDHMYRTTRDELALYASKVKPDGIIAGHDYSMGNWVPALRYGVIEAVHEFCVQNDWELCYLTCEPLESQSFAIRRIQ